MTALYEIALKGSGGERVEPLRYGKEHVAATAGDELAFVRLRYKRPEDGMQAESRLIERPVRISAMQDDPNKASAAFRLAAAVAATASCCAAVSTRDASTTGMSLRWPDPQTAWIRIR